MSVQFGKVNLDGKPVDPKDLEQVRPVLAPYGPDGEGSICKNNVGLLYRAFYTTKESNLEHQPHISPSGAIIIWDGRLDNRDDLIRELADPFSSSSSDLAIVCAAYQYWSKDTFAKLIGDWAVSIWDPRSQELILAKDFLGTRQLHYTAAADQVTWCTILDPLVLCAGHAFGLEKEYIAGFLSSFPATHITPYVGINSVPASSFVCLSRGRQTITKYWDFDPDKRICYRKDGEYEEHFRSVFAQSIRRRLRSNSPVLAELSGGMDSSSIVCMADLIVRGSTESPRLDTVSYYNDSEPNWNERPFFMKVEEQRGRVGCHIDVASQSEAHVQFDPGRLAATPAEIRPNCRAARQFSALLTSQNNRVVLSGTGGDETMGGVPTPTPELADLLVKCRLRELASRLKAWALNKRKPWIHLLFETIGCFVPHSPVGVPIYHRPPVWLQSVFARNYRNALTPCRRRLTLFGALPSFQENMIALDILRRQIACRSLPEEPAYEIRYPYLDRDFLEFAYSIPREQLIRPGQRRSLMRRALRGIVPDAVINRKRKAFVAREPRVAISSDWATCVELSNVMVTEAMGIVSASRFREALQTARVGGELQIIHLTRTLAVESWLRTFHARTDLRLQPAKAVQHTRHVGNGVEFIGP